MTAAHLTLITGGSRSGKSSYALALARERAGQSDRAVFLATAEATDTEMRTRIANHQLSRPAIFDTIEEPLAICDALARLNDQTRVLVIDCLTIWVSNLMAAERSDEAIISEAQRLAELLRAAPYCSFVITDEVGSGIVPMAPLGRRFRDLLGWSSQIIGHAADRIVLMVAGHPLHVK
jgi:adenosylcobinamide kinase / adenosylcobinamide-phosphate guanylyltransferase